MSWCVPLLCASLAPCKAADWFQVTFDTQLVEREAFKTMFSLDGTLELLDSHQVSSPGEAVANARAFAAEVVQMLKDLEHERAA